MPSVIGKTPVNQLNALPLVTADATANPGDVLVVGGTVTRFWSPTNTGINGASFAGDPDDTSALAIFSNFFDVTGCNRFQMVLSRIADTLANDTAADVAAVAITLLVQYRALGVNPRTGSPVGTTDSWQVGAVTPRGGNNLPVGQRTYPMTQVIVKNFGLANDNPSAGATQGTMMGTDCRLWLRATAAPGTGITYSVSLWGST
jgi:hypothetical protein